MTTFAQQAETYLTAAATRQRHPMRTGTARSYRSYLRAHLLPALGDLDLSAVGNASVRPIIANLSAKLKPATIQPIFNLIKQIVASDVDENGDQKHPRTWNSEFLDIPVLDSTAQHAPIMARKTLQEAFLGGSEQDRLLWAFLAGSRRQDRGGFCSTYVPRRTGQLLGPGSGHRSYRCPAPRGRQLGTYQDSGRTPDRRSVPAIKRFDAQTGSSGGFRLRERRARRPQALRQVSSEHGFPLFSPFSPYTFGQQPRAVGSESLLDRPQDGRNRFSLRQVGLRHRKAPRMGGSRRPRIRVAIMSHHFLIGVVAGLIAGLLLARLAYDEYILWLSRESNCNCEHKPGCPYGE